MTPSWHVTKFTDAVGVRPGTPAAHAYTWLDFETAARRYGKVGGFAHLATLVKQLKASRPGALLLDGGDTWQGSATALWSNAQDMVDACKLLGVDVMTAHWEMTYGQKRVQEIVEKDFKGRIDFVAGPGDALTVDVAGGLVTTEVLAGVARDHHVLLTELRQSFAEAESEFRTQLAALERAMPADHPATGMAQYWLARTLLAQGKYEEAVTRSRRASEIVPFLCRIPV